MTTAWPAPQIAQQAARRTREIVRSSVGTTAVVAQRTTDQVVTVVGAVGERTQKVTERTSQTMQTLVRTGTALARGVQEAQGEYLAMVQERMRANLDGVTALVSCRTLAEFLAAHGAFVRSHLELTLTNSRRIAELSTKLATSATAAARVTTVQLEQGVSRAA